MTIPLSSTAANVPRVADAIDSRLVTLTQQVRDVRETVILTGALPSTTLRDFFRSLLETQRFVGERAALTGLGVEYVRRFPDLPGDFDFAKEWEPVGVAIGHLIDWCRALYEKSGDQPVFERLNPETGQLEAYPVKLDKGSFDDFLAALSAYLKVIG